MPGPGSGPQYTPATDKHGRVTRYRVELPRAGIVETQEGHFEATEFAEQRTGWSRYLKDRLLGATVSTARLQDVRLSKRLALPAFSSDAISSTAYATQEITLILAIAGSGAVDLSLPIAIGIVALLAVLISSYSQLIRAYPQGGGGYRVALDNIGTKTAVVAASALLIDYALTVAVAVSAAVAAITSAVPDLYDARIAIAAAVIMFLAIANLRGLRESGAVFAVPVYGFVLLLGGTLVAGVFQVVIGDGGNVFEPGEPRRQLEESGSVLMWFLVLRAFSTGAAALTGVETISNSVPSFKEPGPRNAIATLALMAGILAVLFLGTTLLARHYGLVYLEGDEETLLSLLGKEVLGENALYYLLQVLTAGILLVAAHSAFGGFPRLTAMLATDGFLPRVFYQRGNRLVYSYGIGALGGISLLLVVLFGASTTNLVPLYAFGAFVCFTIAQFGLFWRWNRSREEGWRRRAIVNGVGAAVTGVAALIIMVTKFLDGAWIVALVIPLVTIWLWRVGGFYRALRRVLYVAPEAQLDIAPKGESRVPILVPVEEVNLAGVMTLGAACERSRDVTAIHVRVNPQEVEAFESRWVRQFPGVPLVVIDSPFRTVADPIARYIDDVLKRPPHEVTVMVPLLEVRRWYHRPLVNQSLKRLTSLLAERRHVTVVPYPFYAGGVPRRRKIKKGIYMGNG